jgi:hypothetical protein
VLNDHHGVGLRLLPYMSAQYGPGMTALRRIKQGMDPNNILCPASWISLSAGSSVKSGGADHTIRPVVFLYVRAGSVRRRRCLARGRIGQRVGDQLDHIADDQRRVVARPRRLEHLHAERAAHRQHFRAGGLGLLIARER